MAFGGVWIISDALHSLGAFKRVPSKEPRDKSQKQILQWLLDWNGLKARGDSFIRLTKNQDSSRVKSTQSPQSKLRTIITFTRKREKRKRKTSFQMFRNMRAKRPNQPWLLYDSQWWSISLKATKGLIPRWLHAAASLKVAFASLSLWLASHIQLVELSY